MEWKKLMLWLIPVVLLSGFVLSGPIMSDVEQARYTVVKTEGDFEIRDYAPQIVAETETSGSRKEAISDGFKQIADYIFGNNISNDKVAMTAPVLQQSNEKIAMTAPVLQEETEGKWLVRFVMPAEYTLDKLPRPNNPAIHLTEVPAKHMAAITFSGLADDELLKQKQGELEDYLQKSGLNASSKPVYAFYNPPWTLPLLRRNEVMVELQK